MSVHCNVCGIEGGEDADHYIQRTGVLSAELADWKQRALAAEKERDDARRGRHDDATAYSKALREVQHERDAAEAKVEDEKDALVVALDREQKLNDLLTEARGRTTAVLQREAKLRSALAELAEELSGDHSRADTGELVRIVTAALSPAPEAKGDAEQLAEALAERKRLDPEAPDAIALAPAPVEAPGGLMVGGVVESVTDAGPRLAPTPPQTIPADDGESFKRSLCVECGPDVGLDEDGCCASCGATAVGHWLDEHGPVVPAELGRRCLALLVSLDRHYSGPDDRLVADLREALGGER